MLDRLATWLGYEKRAHAGPSTWDFIRTERSGVDPRAPLAAEDALATVLACVNVISSTAASLPAYVYRWQGKRRELADQHPVQRLIDRGPNQHQSWQDWLEWVLAACLLHGNAISEIEVDGRGAVTGLRPVRWMDVAIVDLPRGRLGYDVTDPQTGATRRLLQDEILHLRDRTDDGRIGISRLQRAAGVISQALSINAFSRQMWLNGAFPSGVIEGEHKIDDVQLSRLRDHWRNFHEGPSNAARALILGQGLKYKGLSVSPEDAELLQSRRFTTEELARIFGVPPIMVGIWDKATFTNASEAARWFASQTLAAWTRKLQGEFKRSVFTEPKVELEIDLSGLLRGDPEARWASHKIAVEAKILLPNEVREVEGWPPLPEPTPTVA